MDYADKLDMMDDDCDIQGFPLKNFNKDIKQLIEKQMPKKIDIFDYGKAHCPNCKTDIHGIGKIKYCFNCGQKLEWL